MTVTYTPTINLKDLSTQETGITVLRSDDNTNPATEATYVILSTLAKTPEQKLQVVEDFKALIISQDNKQTQIDDAITELEGQLKSALETWEATR